MKNNLQKFLAAAMAVCIGAIAPMAPAHAGLFSATRPVIAILDGDLFVGEAEGHLDGSGTIAINSKQNPTLTCVGEFITSKAKEGGSGTLRCSDGGSASFRIQRLTIYKGHGAGATSRGTMSFAYGLSAAESAPYLKLPDGKKLGISGSELALVENQ